MNFDTSDYFAYKKNKVQLEAQKPKGQISKANFIFQLFIATFIIMFIIIVVGIMKYSSKMDIEYTKGDLALREANEQSPFRHYGAVLDDEPRKIDKRLMLIQQEENAPCEARITNRPKDSDYEIIDPIHIEESLRMDKLEKIEKRKELLSSKGKNQGIILPGMDDAKENSLEDEFQNNNITIMSKVLIGRYETFEEAQKVQIKIKEQNDSLSPFVKKIGDVYSIQMGSYQDFSVAKNQAQLLKSEGYDVWIYQQ